MSRVGRASGGFVLVAVLAGCGGAPVELFEKLAAGDAPLATRLRPAPGTWQRDADGLSSPGWRSAALGPSYEVGARLPLRADGALEIGVGRSPDYTLRLVPERARDSRVRDEGGRALYPGAYASTDLLFVTEKQRVEWFLLLRDSSAATEFSWSVVRPKGLPQIRREPSGAIVFADKAGTARLRVPRPYAFDARGTRRDATVDYRDGRLVVRVATEGLVFPILLDPAVESAVWVPISATPPTRADHAMAYDGARGRAVIFGGHASNGLLGDTWEYDGAAATWTQVATSGSPPPRFGHAMIYDGARGRVVLFGGEDDFGGGFFGDTWEYDGATATWAHVPTTGSPSARLGPAMVYDGARGRVVLFAGSDSSGSPLGDTWEYDGTTSTWSRAATTGNPTARSEHAMAYDAARGRITLFGGYSGVGSNRVLLGDTWEYDGSTATWTQPAATGLSTGRAHHAMIYDAGRDRTLLFGGESGSGGVAGDTWEYDGSTATWTQASTTGPDAREGHGMVYDVARARTLLFGGTVSIGSSRLDGDTWEYDGTAGGWTQTADAITGPAARWAHAMIYDSARARTVLFGGDNSPTRAGLDDTWEYDGLTATWSQVATTGRPSARTGHVMVYDSARGLTVLYGGADQGVDADDTWEYDGASATWSPVTTTGSPGARSMTAMVYDGARARSVLFGGLGGAVLDDTWEYDGATATWTQVTTIGSPSARASHSMVYDGARGKIVLFGGSGFRDTWEYDGSTATWAQVITAGAPTVDTQVMAYDGARRRTVLFGFSIHNFVWPVAGTWEYDATTAAWTQLAGDVGPSSRSSPAMIYDDARDRAVLFGGLSSDHYDGDTWELHLAGGPCTQASQCQSGACTDGVCCDRATCGPCQDCNTAGHPGVCAAVTDAQDPDTCSGANACDATGECVAQEALGAICTADILCTSGHCVGGVCCDSACAGACAVCTRALGAGADGTCSPALPGASGAPSCAPFVCNGAMGCPTQCAQDADCASGLQCESGACALPPAMDLGGSVPGGHGGCALGGSAPASSLVLPCLLLLIAIPTGSRKKKARG